MKTAFLFPAIVLFICCAEFHAAKGKPQVPEELPTKAEVAAKEQTPNKALEEPTKKPEETKPAMPVEANDTHPKQAWSFKLGGELTNYFISRVERLLQRSQARLVGDESSA